MPATPAPSGLRLSLTERNWLVALGLALIALAAVAAWEHIEREALRMPVSSTFDFMRSVGEKTARFLGIAHFLVAFLFLGTSRRIRNRSAARRLTWLIGAAVVLCGMFAGFQAAAPALASAMFIALFLVHDLRDQVYFYRANGDVAEEPNDAELDGALFRIPTVLIGAAAALAAILLATNLVEANRSSEVTDLKEGVPTIVALAFVALGLAVIVEALRKWRTTSLGPRVLWRRHRAAVVVLGGTIGLLALSAILTSKAHWIVIVHVTAWYVFTITQLARRAGAGSSSRRPRPGSWAWWRGTAPGFTLLHGGALLLVIALVAIWSYGFGWSSSSPLAWLISREAFPLWTIAHVTVSFVPR